MVFVICLFVLLSIGTSANAEREAIKLSVEATTIIRAVIQKCIQKTGVSPGVIGLVRAGKYQEDHTYKEYVHCIYRESGFANPDGHVIISKAVSLFPKEINILPIFENCDKQGKDPIETNFLAFKCFQDISPVLLALL